MPVTRAEDETRASLSTDVNIFGNRGLKKSSLLILTYKYTGEGNFQLCSALLGCVIILMN